MGLDPVLRRLAEAIGDEVAVPDGWGCCGFAGNRDLLRPELTAVATQDEARSVLGGGFDA
jgi:D-lactate dehydrogenase